MKNKIKFKKYLFGGLFVSLILLVMFIFINIFEYKSYTVSFNKKVNDMVSFILDKYPDIGDDELMEIINSKSSSKNVLKKYSIDLNNESILLENDKKFNCFLIINILFLMVSLFVILFIFIRYKKSVDKDIKDITKLIEEINKRNYELNIDSISEDELSILKNEIYKTTIMLKEAADNSLNDKVNLKKSLEDISHQLKTPLTSILIMLDNIIEDNEMDSKIRNEFIIDIKRNVNNINFLIQSILKLSKFDSNTISYIRDDICIRKIIDTCILNVSTLSDLCNVSIEVEGDLSGKIYCDFNWQVEAVTNILKNAIDHSKNGDKVIIKGSSNSVYSSIEVENFGDRISSKDIGHIFERFYKGENSKSDSIGIGLALAKTIIEEDNGSISVSSDDKSTIFMVKYFKL